MKIRDLAPRILRESFTDISVEKLGIDSVVKQADVNLSDEAADAIDRFVGVAHNAREQQDVWGGIMQSRQLEDAYSAKPSEQGKKIRDQLTQAFAPVKTALQSRFGNVITLYRGQEEIDKEQTERSTLSWTSDPRIAALFARIAPWEMKLKPVTDEQIRAALNTYAKTGEVKFLRLRYVRTDIPTEDNGEDEFYYDIYDKDGELLTDGDNLEKAFKDEQSYYQELIDKREAKKSRILTAKIPIDDIIWITDRAGQSEFILRNQAGRAGYVDTKGKLVKS